MTEPRTRFPSRPGGLAMTLSDEPVLIDGMKVLFDTKVTLYPVTLKPGPDADDSERADERDSRGRNGY
ncbi:MAG TPA: hypothetical protein VJT68_03700 [Thermoleophilaceae bacterium]|nr:hypothetical protein [Thermoleophilaceae bacterium]